MLELTTVGSHACSQALSEVCHRLDDNVLVAALPRSSATDFQLISRLGLRLEFMVLFQHGPLT